MAVSRGELWQNGGRVSPELRFPTLVLHTRFRLEAQSAPPLTAAVNWDAYIRPDGRPSSFDLSSSGDEPGS
jgi:hypothetical protein